ncbi:PREDICTED: acidic amino acid decarboxylase GADL1-like [Aptenodytes forsteri]|uniref:acidic amino acid decarboxylase GADL1-like n=1 Tax=Aptenodytes forsteri TaxID=9233 RepID=UPI000905577C|nr:PREDICTED: acidic amino acid decarboxylase GADL1-like [Aptenodytes forsteri]
MDERSGTGVMAESSQLEHPGLDKAAGEEFLREAFQVLLDEAVRKGTDVTEKVCDWKEPRELRELLDLELRSDGEPPEKLLERCRDIIRYSVKTSCGAGRAPPVTGRAWEGEGVSPTAQVAPAIKERMMRKGSMMVSYQPHGAKVNFSRQIVPTPAVTRDDLDFFLDEIERLGRDL